MNLPTSYRGMIRLAKKLNVKLTPSACMPYRHTINPSEGCALGLLGYANGLGTYLDVLKYSPDEKLSLRMRGLEAGFENFRFDGSAGAVYSRYYKVGQRLREYSCGNA